MFINQGKQVTNVELTMIKRRSKHIYPNSLVKLGSEFESIEFVTSLVRKNMLNFFQHVVKFCQTQQSRSSTYSTQLSKIY